MKQMLKTVRFFTALLLAGALLAGLLPPCAQAGAGGECGKGLYWALDDDGVLTVSGTGDMDSYVESSPPWNSTKVRKAVLEPGVTSIGATAFYRCSRLTDVEIPDTVTRIEDYAFDSCSRLERISVPDSVIQIGANPFCGCGALKEIILSPDHPALEVRDGLLLSRADRRAVCRIPAYEGSAECVIPEGTELIGDRAFTGTEDIISLVLPDSVTKIGKAAFRGCSALVRADIPAGVVSIGSFAFAGCRQLREITLREGLVSVGTAAFDDCRDLERIELPDSLADLGERAFYACGSLREILLSPDHAYLGFEQGVLFTKTDRKLVFYAAGSESDTCTVPEGIRIIGTRAFRNGDRLRKIVVPGSVVKIESEAFDNCALAEEIVFSPGLEEIAPSGLAGLCGLKDIVLPEGLKTVGDCAFGGCEALETILIPESVTEIGEDLFAGADTVNLVVYAREGSAAAQYCRDRGLLTAEPGQEAPRRTAELPPSFAEAYAGYAGLYEIESTEDEAVYLAGTPEGALVLLCGRMREDGTWSIVESATLPAESRVVLYEGAEMLDVGTARCTVRRYHDDLWGIGCIGWRSIYLGPKWLGGEELAHLYGRHPWADLTKIDWISLDESWQNALRMLDLSSSATPDQPDRDELTPFYASPDPDSEKIADLLNGAPLFVLEQRDGWTKVRLGTDDGERWVLDGWVRTESLAFGTEIDTSRYADRAFLYADRAGTIVMMTAEGGEPFPGTAYDEAFQAVGEKTIDGQDYWLVYDCDTEKLGWILKESLHEMNG